MTKDAREYVQIELDDAINKIIKDHGEYSIIEGIAEEAMSCDVIPTGALTLDLALGVGGIPRGRTVE